jgi:hypothetical protein
MRRLDRGRLDMLDFGLGWFALFGLGFGMGYDMIWKHSGVLGFSICVEMG